MNRTDKLVETLLAGTDSPWYAKFHTGVENPYTEGYGEEDAYVDVYEFPSAETQQKFLEEVGGSPHPLGGCRVILSR